MAFCGTDKVDHVLVIKGEAVNDIFYRTIDGWRNLLVLFTAKIQGRPMNHMASIQNICADGDVGVSHPAKIFKFARKLVNSQPSCKRVGHYIFVTFLF